MAERFTKEYITLPYHPQVSITPDTFRELARLLEGILQRLEGRIEVLQATVTTLETRLAALE